MQEGSYLPLPLKINAESGIIELTDGVKLLEFDQEKSWGYKVVKKQDSTSFKDVNDKAPFYWSSKNFIDNPLVGEWPVSCRWFVYIPPHRESEVMNHVISCIKLLTEFRVDSPVYLSILNWGKGPRTGVVYFADTFNGYVDDIPLDKEQIGELKTLVGSYSKDNIDVIERFLLASRTKRQRTEEYITGLVGVLDRLYGSDRGSGYKFKVNFFLAHPKEAKKQNWDLLNKAYAIRSKYSHGKKPEKFMTPQETKRMEELVKVALKHFLREGQSAIDKAMRDDNLIIQLAK